MHILASSRKADPQQLMCSSRRGLGNSACIHIYYEMAVTGSITRRTNDLVYYSGMVSQHVFSALAGAKLAVSQATDWCLVICYHSQADRSHLGDFAPGQY